MGCCQSKGSDLETISRGSNDITPNIDSLEENVPILLPGSVSSTSYKGNQEYKGFQQTVDDSIRPVSNYQDNLSDKYLKPQVHVDNFATTDCNLTRKYSPQKQFTKTIINTVSSKFESSSNDLNNVSKEGLILSKETLPVEGVSVRKKNKALINPLPTRKHSGEKVNVSTTGICVEKSRLYVNAHTEAEDFENLEPICEISAKEVVSIETDICGIKKENVHIDKLLYVIIAHRIFESLLQGPLKIVEICSLLNEMTEQMKFVVNTIAGESLPSKVEIFVRSFHTVFEVKRSFVVRLDSGESWLRAVVLDSLKDVLVDIIQEGKNCLADLIEYLVCALGCSSIPEIGDITDTNISNFLIKYKNIFGVAGQAVFLVPTVKKSFGPNVDQGSLKEVVSFFKELLKTCAIPYTELPMILSMTNPELLAVLVDRTCGGILTLLQRDKAFKCVDGIVMLQGFTPISPNLIQSKTLPNDTPNAKEVKLETCCSSGIVICVGKSRATLWCSYSETCKNVLIVVKRSETFVNLNLGNNLEEMLYVGDKVVFTTKSNNMSDSGWCMDLAVHVKTVQGNSTTCLCKEKRTMDVFYQQVAQENGIPFLDTFLFFWNCRGTLESLNVSKGSVKCMFSNSNDQYFRVFFTDKTWFVGLDCKPSELEKHFSVGDAIELDVSLRNFNHTGMLMWHACCIRKLQKAEDKTQVAWDCLGTISEKAANGFLITIEEGPHKGTIVFCPITSILLFDDGSTVTNFDPDVLNLNDKVVIDVEKPSKGSWIAKFIRQHKRPVAVHLPVTNDSTVVVSALQDVMTRDFPSFPAIALGNVEDPLTLRELEEIIHQKESLASELVFGDLSWSSDSYDLLSDTTHIFVKNTTCQTVSTGPVLSTWLPN